MLSLFQSKKKKFSVGATNVWSDINIKPSTIQNNSFFCPQIEKFVDFNCISRYLPFLGRHFETADQFKACTVSLGRAQNHQKTSQKQVWTFTHSTKIVGCCFSPLLRQFFFQKGQLPDLSYKKAKTNKENSQILHRQGKAGSHRLHDRIQPCLAENEN